ncbi:MAG: Gfo/Idh/MocA family oxidoreductase [Planctomycetaceae bacterium]|nr:Gfo/Idh/MocA family oxidoreductase [Planctomycetaceae bacterium]
MDQLRLAVIGVGALGRHHARILSTMDGVKLIAVADPRPEQARAVAESCGCDWTTDFRTLFGRIDAASVVVPTSLHRPVAAELLQRSIPVLVEKPLAPSIEDGQLLVRLAAEHKVALQVGHIERFNPAFQQVAAACGSPRYLRAERFSPYAFRSMDIGAVLDLMIHDIDLTLSLVRSNLVDVQAFGLCLVGGHEDAVQARLTFANGCIADLTANRVCPTFSRFIQVWSSAGCFSADLHQRKVTEFRPGAALLAGELPYELAQQPGANIDALKQQMFERFFSRTQTDASQEDALTAELSSFVTAVRRHTTPVVDGVQGLAALQAAMRILDSVRSHQWDNSAAGRIGPHALQPEAPALRAAA